MSKKNAPPLDAKQRRRIETAPRKWQDGLRKAMQGTIPPRYAIKMQCLECNGFSQADITNCTGTACPLFQYRPFQKGRKIPAAGGCQTVGSAVDRGEKPGGGLNGEPATSSK